MLEVAAEVAVTAIAITAASRLNPRRSRRPLPPLLEPAEKARFAGRFPPPSREAARSPVGGRPGCFCAGKFVGTAAACHEGREGIPLARPRPAFRAEGSPEGTLGRRRDDCRRPVGRCRCTLQGGGAGGFASGSLGFGRKL